MRLLPLFFIVFGISLSVFASEQQIDLKTPRGSQIKLDLYNLGLSKALLLAPGQGCSARLDLYDTLAAEAKNNGFTLIRLYWAYCLTSPNGNPSDDLSVEKEDFLTALHYVRKNLGFSDANIAIGGKSLGTFVTSDIFHLQKELRQLVLLTPVCTDATDPKNPQNVFASYYPDLGLETRSVLLVQGNKDPLCSPIHFHEYIMDKHSNFNFLVTAGDHSLGIKNPDGNYNPELGAKNLQAISKWIFSWLK